MGLLVENCPRCKANQITFDVLAEHAIDTVRYGWQRVSEIFCRCRHCDSTVIFRVAQLPEMNPLIRAEFLSKRLLDLQQALNNYVRVEGYIGIKDFAAVAPPDYCPLTVEAVFREGGTCLGVECFNAAGTMFRLCIDLATRAVLPPEGAEGGPNAKQRRDLGLRLPWLFDNGVLPEALRELSHCIKEDGNDGAHAGTLKKEDAEDLLEFTTALLERVYTEPEKLRLAQERRNQRRGKAAPADVPLSSAGGTPPPAKEPPGSA